MVYTSIMVAFSKLQNRITSTISANNYGIAAAGAVAVAFFIWNKGRLERKEKMLDDKDEKEHSAVSLEIKHKKSKKSKSRVAVDNKFFRDLFQLIKIVIPGWLTPETGLLALVAASLVTRTYCDLWMIQNTTSIERSVIGRDIDGFRKNILAFVYRMPLLSIVNNILKYGLNELELCLRTRMTKHLLSKYLSNFVYYKISNLDTRISNPDQLLTQDVEKFCSGLVELYSNLSKPILDIILYVYRLSGAIGVQGPLAMLGYLILSGVVLTRLRRPAGKMTVEEQHLEGEYRYVNSRLLTNSEEIAFYQGDSREKLVINHAFQRLMNHLRTFLQFRVTMGFFDSIIAKYISLVVGFSVVSIPFLSLSNPKYINSTYSERLQDYYVSGRMIVKMMEAVGRVALAGRELTRLAGFTERVKEIIDVLKDLNEGIYKRTMVSSGMQDAASNGSSCVRINTECPSGTVIECDHIIRFENVPLVTPNGDVLIRELNFQVESGMNVLVCGPNGCGKSSLFRILGELWPLFGGKLVKPHRSKLFYVPQRPYLAIGSLRDQVIYPDSVEQQREKKITDEELEEFLKQVQLEYILEREGGWDAVQDWMDVLSGGEKQRIAMARLFYHRPQFAILDECTSAVSVDVEGFIYSHCREIGITLFTVSHRKSLWKHHEFVLYMDGRGSYDFKKIDPNVEEFGS
ncbi:ATP-binding cassette sub-family D member 3-like [Xenia sp. Carnegie-2017]|uniref:ATP-binding cassette sub-family D member 3-like n=1 Tax=Xenia sp. Carnegie-2017 TaxID=2897299 RepID=UPI001F041364|nr:ATP-binding cassette sub-family D member 3-like [Xenia sp. Carnegie-2017]XP_046846153.1 ATP-binding cassette sub-family D member 3-like [Xenia sp. Carnegie-2017]